MSTVSELLKEAPAYRKVGSLIENGSATSDARKWPGGKGCFRASATWGGGTVKLQMLGPDDATWTDVGTDTTLTADGGGNFELPPCMIRANVATATAVYARVDGI